MEKKAKEDVVRAKITPELRSKINADMERFRIRNESEYVRMMIAKDAVPASDPGIKELLEKIIDAMGDLKNDVYELSVRFKDLDFEVTIMKREVENLECNPEKAVRRYKREGLK